MSIDRCAETLYQFLKGFVDGLTGEAQTIRTYVQMKGEYLVNMGQLTDLDTRFLQLMQVLQILQIKFL